MISPSSSASPSSSDERNTRFLYPLAHDLKAPLNRILGLAQLMDFTRDQLNDEQKEYLDKIRQIAFDAENMISNMVDAYRVKEDEFDEQLMQIDLRALLASRIDTYRDVARLKKISLHFEAPAQPAEVMSGKLLLERVVDNLLSNAIKFSPNKKKIIVTLTVEADFVVFSVADEGPGIRPREQKQLYKKFHHLSIRPTAGETTTSLGLYLTKTLLEKVNGTIQCESKPREGACFTVTLRTTAPQKAPLSKSKKTSL